MNILSVSAHPDDQLFWAGMLRKILKNSVSKRNSVFDLTLTCGEAGINRSENNSTPLQSLRQKENCDAMTELLVGLNSDVRHLHPHLKDGTLPQQEAACEKAISDAIMQAQPQVILSFRECGGDDHDDHKAVCKALASTLEKLHWDGTLYSFTLPTEAQDLDVYFIPEEERKIVKDFATCHLSQFGSELTHLKAPHSSLLSMNCYELHLPHQH